MIWEKDISLMALARENGSDNLQEGLQIQAALHEVVPELLAPAVQRGALIRNLKRKRATTATCQKKLSSPNKAITFLEISAPCILYFLTILSRVEVNWMAQGPGQLQITTATERVSLTSVTAVFNSFFSAWHSFTRDWISLSYRRDQRRSDRDSRQT